MRKCVELAIEENKAYQRDYWVAFCGKNLGEISENEIGDIREMNMRFISGAFLCITIINSIRGYFLLLKGIRMCFIIMETCK